MSEGLVRTDSNKGGATFRNGQPVTLPHNFGNPVMWTPNSAHFGNPVPPADPTFNSNPVDWQTPNPAHFGNTVGGVVPPTAAGFELEDSSGVILLEDGSILLLEIQ